MDHPDDPHTNPQTPPAEPSPDHVPVLAREVFSVLTPATGDVLVDCTAGLGGHAAQLAAEIGSTGRVILIDRDQTNLARAHEHVAAATDAPVEAIHAPFSSAREVLKRLSFAADIVLADLGFASTQVDDADRGLSFRLDGPLDMRLDPTSGPTAAELVAEMDETDLAEVIYRLGEERLSRRIARKIVEVRESQPITTTQQLAEIVRSAVPPPRPSSRKGHGSGPRIHPATRTFQALRIAVNDELGELDRLLRWIGESAAAPGRPGGLQSGARVGIISFHSLEDRPVKQAFNRLADNGLATRLTRKPIEASAGERDDNPRSRSAKLRAIRITGD
ncbi:MAG: 16S rRNA (cytosine(1402)-N(4))-methyltransferase RsmH [Planctomycetota bacterium]